MSALHNALFHDQLIVAVLASGSRGNCTYIGDGRSGVLVDCGISTRQILSRMAQIGLADAPISAVVVTHEHSDHVAAARVLDDRILQKSGNRIPFYMTRGTAQRLSDRVMPKRVERVEPGRHFQIGSLTIEPTAVPHDGVDPVAYAVSSGGARAGVITDLGRSTRLVEAKLASLDVAVVEFNHDVELLMDGPYPWQLKQRIRSPHGHLSNEQAAEMLERAVSVGRLKEVVLAHLSEENNRPERALLAADQAVVRARRHDVRLHCGKQAETLAPIKADVPLDRVQKPAPLPRRQRRRESRPEPRAETPVPVSPVQMSLFG
ncbi:MAG: MBL fold metallo-hydrolase [Deltaproteobacteria bacterium]|nr:MAG: MBL fold metallo-hydrolase [Deltaproteobacteria bacterium]